MGCILNVCDGSGNIWLKNGDAEPCDCVKIRRAIWNYKISLGDEKLMKFSCDLKENPIVKTEDKRDIRFKDLMLQLTSPGVMDKLIESNVHLFLVGEKGFGKSQFASTLLYTYNWNNESPGLYIDVRKFKDYIFDAEERKKIHDKLKVARVVIIDDIGAESTVQNGSLQYIIDELDYIARNHTGLLIVTSNKFKDKLHELYTDNGNKKADYDRMISALVTGNSKMYVFKDKNIRAESKSEALNLIP